MFLRSRHRTAKSTLAVCIFALAIAGCSNGHSDRISQPGWTPAAPNPKPKVCSGRRSTQKQIVGKPYAENGRWYFPAYDPDYDRVGTASWYGAKYHGRPTASGEIYNMYQMTTAHPTLPMPSRVRVTNLGNGRSIVLRVNDRGPFNKGRLIDVSRAAARALGFERQGLARVRVRYLGPAPLVNVPTC